MSGAGPRARCRSGRRRSWYAAGVACLGAVLLTACTGGQTANGADGSRSPSDSTESQSRAGSPSTAAPTTSRPTSPTTDRATPSATAGVALSHWLPFGALEVRALGYRRAGVTGARTSRIDVVTVEECADTGSALVRHSTWHLVDATGRTLGVAGAKAVDHQPTEDIPRRLEPSQCMQTELAIGVPQRSVAAAVKDGRHDTWDLAR